MADFRDILLILIGVVLAIDVHECAHAWSADKLGDPTARFLGRVTLNPIKHLDPLGTVMIVMSSLSGFGIGWGKPTPVNPYRLKYGPRAGMALVSVAGPLSNLLTAFILMLPYRIFGRAVPPALLTILATWAFVNVILTVFNLIPLPPLDGFSVLMGILTSIRSASVQRVTRALSQIEAYGPMVLLAVLAVGWVTGRSLLGAIMGQPVDLLWKLIAGW
ncbi:MAG: site-2 protease family protein [Chloroflexi bacterium]|nr:site-2 protease family protein [Chloroflexota bacterium]